MKAFWTFLVGVTGVWFSGASFYNIYHDPSEILFWIFFIISLLVFLRADAVVNVVYRWFGPKPMAVHIIGTPPKRFRKGF